MNYKRGVCKENETRIMKRVRRIRILKRNEKTERKAVKR